MQTAQKALLTVDEFLASADEREGKWELRDGVAVCMAPERLGHGLTKLAAVNALAAAIRRAGVNAEAVPNGVGVRIPARSMYAPDALVYCGPRLPPDTLEIPDPVIVVEVLSPSKAGYDQNDKIAGYFSLPSVMHYLILNPATRRGVHHKRGQGDLIETRLLREGALRLDPPDIEVEVGELFGAELDQAASSLVRRRKRNSALRDRSAVLFSCSESQQSRRRDGDGRCGYRGKELRGMA
jgi:Uma2 family endonuclease